MLPQPQPNTSMALRGLISRSFSCSTRFVPMVSLSWAARGTCSLAAGCYAPPTIRGCQESTLHAAASRCFSSNAQRLAPRRGAVGASSPVGIAQPPQPPRRAQLTESAGVLGAVSDVAHSTHSAGRAVPESSGRAVADTFVPATLQSAAEPVRESSGAASLDDANSSPRGDSGHSSGAGAPSAGGASRRAGAFQRLPMVQLAKEQLSSAQRAARRTPYSRKLKNEAQRERNRYRIPSGSCSDEFSPCSSIRYHES